MEHVMVDIETLGTQPNSVILSIAAVEFCIKTGKTGRVFYQKINLLSAINKGLQIDTETLTWWTTQKPEQFTELFADTIPLKKVLKNFIKWFNPGNEFIWANSPSFDLILIENALQKCQLQTPWRYYNERCVRTLLQLHPNVKNTIPKPINAHNAVADCEYQIQCCVNAYKQVFNTINN